MREATQFPTDLVIEAEAARADDATPTVIGIKLLQAIVVRQRRHRFLFRSLTFRSTI